MKLAPWLPLIATCLSCETNEIYRYDLGHDQGHDQGPAVETEIESPTFLPTGSPCTEEDAAKCFGGFCLTTEFAKAIDPRAEVPGGACSKIGCSSDEECGPGAFCLTGVPDIPLPICLPSCEDFSQCRYSEGYVCFGTEELGERRACLPAQIVVLFRCGDNICDANEQANPALCPEDCQ